MTTQSTRFTANAGIAIGPILFVVAILAVLVGALAAGSGGFGSSTANDSNRINGSTLIEQGTNLKTGMDRIMVNGASIDSVVVSQATSVDPTIGLFSATGGGLTYQNPPAQVVDATINNWRYVYNGNVTGIGNPNKQSLAVAQVRNIALCQAINGIIFGKNAAQATTIPFFPTAATTTNLTIANDVPNATCTDTNLASTTSGCAPGSNKFDISTIAVTNGISGRTQACISDGGTTPKYYYYQLLYSN